MIQVLADLVKQPWRLKTAFCFRKINLSITMFFPDVNRYSCSDGTRFTAVTAADMGSQTPFASQGSSYFFRFRHLLGERRENHFCNARGYSTLKDHILKRLPCLLWITAHIDAPLLFAKDLTLNLWVFENCLTVGTGQLFQSSVRFIMYVRLPEIQQNGS